MFMRRMLGALLLSSLTVSAIADNTLIIPEKSKLLVLDGKEADQLNSNHGLALGNGRHQLVFQLKALVRDGGDTNLFASSPYIMTFDLSGDQTYTIKGPMLKTARDTDRLSHSPKAYFSLTDGNGQNIPFEFSVLNKSGLLIGADTVEDIQKFNLSDNPAAVQEMAGTVYIAAPQGAAYQVAHQSQPAVLPPPAAAQPMSESMLQYWYNQADEVTRERFLKWVAENQGTGQ